MSICNNFVVKILSEICRKAIYSSLGESASEAILFFLRRDLGRDPFEVFWEDPRAFYRAVERFFGAGTKVLVNLLVTSINKECGLNMSSERFLELMQRGDQHSVEEIRSFLTKIAEVYRRKGEGA